MARSTLYNFGRANRPAGTIITPTFTIPSEEGVLRGTLDVLPNQRTDPGRVIDFYFEVQFEANGPWGQMSHGRWRGNPDSTTMPTEEFASVGGGLDLRGLTARWRVVTTTSINFGGTIEWLDYAEAGW